MYAEQQGPSYTIIHATPVRVQPPPGAVAFVCTSGCSVCMMMFGIFLTIAGAIMTGTSYKKPSPPFDDPFFTKNDANNPLRIVGPVFLAIGLLLMLSSLVLCCILMAKHRGRRGQVPQSNSQVHTETSIQPSSGYPQQLQASHPQPSGLYQQNMPTSSYSSQQSASMSPYPSQQAVPGSYPTQKYGSTNYPIQQNVPTSSHPYQQNVPPSSTQQNDIPPPSYYECIREAQSDVPSKIALNDSSENDTSTRGPVIPSAPAFNVPEAHRYQESKWKP